jgi:hypothetical protein
MPVVGLQANQIAELVDRSGDLRGKVPSALLFRADEVINGGGSDFRFWRRKADRLRR